MQPSLKLIAKNGSLVGPSKPPGVSMPRRKLSMEEKDQLFAWGLIMLLLVPLAAAIIWIAMELR